MNTPPADRSQRTRLTLSSNQLTAVRLVAVVAVITAVLVWATRHHIERAWSLNPEGTLAASVLVTAATLHTIWAAYRDRWPHPMALAFLTVAGIALTVARLSG